MKKKKSIKLIILAIIAVISNVLVFKYCNLESENITVSYKLTSNKSGIYQLYYSIDGIFTEDQSQKVIYTHAGKQQVLKYTISKNIKELRFDLNNKKANVKISDLKLSCLGKSIKLDSTKILKKNNQSQIATIKKIRSYFYIKTIGNDSYIKYKLDSNKVMQLVKQKNTISSILIKLVICIIIDILLLVILKKSKSVLTLIRELNNNRTLIWNLAKNDFKTKYAGSYLGIIWAFIQPIVTILIYWFVFGVGLKAGSPIKGVPFILWLMAGLVPWFFFQDALLNATNCMIEYSYLVKKVVFKISILPIVKIISALFVHLVFVAFLFFVALAYGFYPSQYTIQIVYYSLCTFGIVLGISYATCAIVIFFKDLGQIISILLQIGVWMTPIMWSSTMVPGEYQWILKLNPIYYIAEGYRDTFMNHVWFYQRYFQLVYFWIVTLGLFVLGATIFKKLKPHFADVL